MFASDYVADQVYLQLYTRNGVAIDLKQFLEVSQDIGEVGVLRGILFERHAHAMIANGGSFQIRALLDPSLNGSIRYEKFGTLPPLVFDNDSD